MKSANEYVEQIRNHEGLSPDLKAEIARVIECAIEDAGEEKPKDKTVKARQAKS